MDKIIMVALITEALWETLKMIKSPGGVNLDRIGVMLLGVLVALVTGIDLFELAGITLKVPFLGSALTGLLISRGSNFIHDVLGSMGQVYQSKKIGSSSYTVSSKSKQ